MKFIYLFISQRKCDAVNKTSLFLGIHHRLTHFSFLYGRQQKSRWILYILHFCGAKKERIERIK